MQCRVSYTVWELVSAAPPFAGLHHGEVIHKVVTEDLRPGEKQLLSPSGCVWLASHMLLVASADNQVLLVNKAYAAQPEAGVSLCTLQHPFHAANLQVAVAPGCHTPASSPRLHFKFAYPNTAHSDWACVYVYLSPFPHPASTGPWPQAATQQRPPAYMALAEACWARQSMKRPTAERVLQQLLHMLGELQGSCVSTGGGEEEV